MSDAIKNEAHRIAVQLSTISEAAKEMTKAASKAGGEGKTVIVGIPAEVLKDFGTVANDAIRLFAAMGVVDRGQVADEMKAQQEGAKALMEGLTPMIDRIRQALEGGADSEEECPCPACELERGRGRNQPDTSFAAPDGRVLH